MAKAAEDRVLGEFSGELTATKERADKAETDLASAREVLTAMDGQVAALTTRAEAAEADLAKLKPKA
jgi:predicted  nucleic acid-binding Zn-ribbon protein